MCGTQNAQNADSCKYCGYLFENFNAATLNPAGKDFSTKSNQVPTSESMNTVPANTNVETFDKTPSSVESMSTISTGPPSFVVSRSLLSSIIPSLAYLIFILFITTSAGFNLSTLAIFVFFIALAVVPVLISPRRYEFFDDSLRIHKIIGADSEIPYSELTLNDVAAGRRAQIVLSVSGKSRQLVIPGNPTNKELGLDLNQFLEKKLKKNKSQKVTQENNQQSQATHTESDANNYRVDTSDQSTNQ